MNSKIHNNSINLICDLDLEKYLGKWYEVAKFSARFQDGLDNVTATYSLKDNGKIEVFNQGYKDGKKRKIKGIAWLRDKACSGGLYVRFFWPFKSEYNVIKLAADYRYAVVVGDSKQSLWLLSRTPKIASADYNEILVFLNDNDFNIKNLIVTKQDQRSK